jgi:hypothetical protein
MVLGAVLLVLAKTSHPDDPAYYKLTEVEELTIYKQGQTELRPTFSLETVAFGMINPGWGKRTSSFGERGGLGAGREDIFVIHNGQLISAPSPTPRSLRGITARVIKAPAVRGWSGLSL